MTTDTALRCALGVSDRTLSDYRSAGLSAKEMERLQTHTAQCPACQTRLAAYEELARTLRAQPDLDGHTQLWRNVQASIAAAPAQSSASRQGRRARGEARSHSAQLWTAFGSIAAVVALSVGFVALFVSRGGWPVATKTTPTPITIHSGSLTWKQVIVPKGFPGVDQSNAAATQSGALIAESDGNTAYACQADKKYVSSPTAWATHDAGASWSIITPNDLPADTRGCRIVVDANDAKALIVSFFPIVNSQQPALPNKWTTYASFDGGTTWDKPVGLQDGNVTMTQASAHGRIYAIRGIAAPNGDLNTALYVSSDQMRSWTRIDARLAETLAPNPSTIHDTGITFAMWVNSATGEVLIETYRSMLLATVDDGTHWNAIDYPAGVYISDPHAPELTARAPSTASGYLMICGVFMSTLLYCTTDDGKTWQERPQTSVPSPALTSPLSLVSLGADGSIYAAGDWSVSNHTLAIYRLPPGATKISDWQRLGAIPYSDPGGSAYGVYPSARGIVLWTSPTYGTSTDSAGNTTTSVQPNYYVATYP